MSNNFLPKVVSFIRRGKDSGVTHVSYYNIMLSSKDTTCKPDS